jgi:hypothetical protein
MPPILKALMERTWATGLLLGIAILLSLAFISSPRSVGMMFGMAADALHNSRSWWMIFAGLPAAFFAKTWRTALVLLVAGFLATVVLGDFRPYGDQEGENGLGWLGLLFMMLTIAATARLPIEALWASEEKARLAPRQ